MRREFVYGVCNVLVFAQLATGVAIKRTPSEELSADLFQPIVAETEKPLKLASLPNRNAGNKDYQYEIKENVFNENSAASGKVKKSDGENGEATYEDSGNTRTSTNKKVFNKTYVKNYTATDQSEIDSILQNFQNKDISNINFGDISKLFKNNDGDVSIVSASEPVRFDQQEAADPPSARFKSSNSGFSSLNTDDLFAEALRNHNFGSINTDKLFSDTLRKFGFSDIGSAEFRSEPISRVRNSIFLNNDWTNSDIDAPVGQNFEYYDSRNGDSNLNIRRW